jgi:SAM-dependent methyltransferase
MQAARRASAKAQDELTREWDRLAEERDRQLRTGLDLSFRHVVAPVAVRLLEPADKSLLLDVGCGTGHFTAHIAPECEHVLGIEPSTKCVEIARRVCAEAPNVSFANVAVEDFGELDPDRQVTAAVAVMVMMTAPDLDSFVRAVWKRLPAGGVFVSVIPHPCFWPIYWGYASESWYAYLDEIFIEAPFKISSDLTSVMTTHIHRPLERYITAAALGGFIIDALEEPMPNEAVSAMYPEPWRFPRFLAMRWVRR